MHPPEVPFKRILAYHPEVVHEHNGVQYRLSAKVPDWMSDDKFVALVLEHCPDLSCLAEGDAVVAQHLQTHKLWDLKVERMPVPKA